MKSVKVLTEQWNRLFWRSKFRNITHWTFLKTWLRISDLPWGQKKGLNKLVWFWVLSDHNILILSGTDFFFLNMEIMPMNSNMLNNLAPFPSSRFFSICCVLSLKNISIRKRFHWSLHVSMTGYISYVSDVQMRLYWLVELCFR